MAVSERKVCLVLGQNRCTQRYQTKNTEYNILVREAVINYATAYGRYGYRIITDLDLPHLVIPLYKLVAEF